MCPHGTRRLAKAGQAPRGAPRPPKAPRSPTLDFDERFWKSGRQPLILTYECVDDSGKQHMTLTSVSTKPTPNVSVDVEL